MKKPAFILSLENWAGMSRGVANSLAGAPALILSQSRNDEPV
jgi:hypothetical protein